MTAQKNESATDIMNLVIPVKNQKKTVVVSGMTVQNDKFNDKEKNVNRLLKRGWEVEKIVFGDNSSITVSMLNHNGLNLNERGTTRLLNNLCSTLTKWRYLICMDNTCTELNDLNSHQTKCN